MEKIKTHKLTLSAMFLAIGLILPFFTGQIPTIGNMLLPMHIPVLLCGMVCGWEYGAAIGFILPFIRYTLFGMPVLFPNGLAMAFELAAYGGISGSVYALLKKKNIATSYISLITAMFLGRIVWGIASSLILGFSNSSFTLEVFIASGFINAIPGIILQLIFIPFILNLLNRNKKTI